MSGVVPSRRNGIGNSSTPPGLPMTFHPRRPVEITFRRPHSRGPWITGLLLGAVFRGAFFQHWRVQGEGSLVYLVGNSWLTVESLRAASAARGIIADEAPAAADHRATERVKLVLEFAAQCGVSLAAMNAVTGGVA